MNYGRQIEFVSGPQNHFSYRGFGTICSVYINFNLSTNFKSSIAKNLKIELTYHVEIFIFMEFKISTKSFSK